MVRSNAHKDFFNWPTAEKEIADRYIMCTNLGIVLYLIDSQSRVLLYPKAKNQSLKTVVPMCQLKYYVISCDD